jgi:hypothetical protein
MYVVTPYPMMKWMLAFVKDNIFNRPDLLEIIPSTKLNPEKSYYYQGDYADYIGIDLDTSLPEGECLARPKAEMDEVMASFESDDTRVSQLWATLKNNMGIDKVLAVEVNHCP